MNKFFKIAIYIIGFSLLLTIIAILLLRLFINPNNFKSQIIKQTQAITGRQLHIEGDLRWTFFPALGIKMQNIAIDNTPDFQKTNFIQAKEAILSVSLKPLLRKNLQLTQVRLDSFSIHLIQNRQGLGNWQNIIHENNTAKINEGKNKSKSNNAFYFNMAGLTISEVKIANGIVTYDDEKTKQQLAAKNINLEAKQINFGQEFPLHLSLDIKNQSLPQAIVFDVHSNVRLDLLAKTIQFNDVVGNINNLKILGKLAIKSHESGFMSQGDINIPNFNANQWIRSIGKPMQIQVLQNASANFHLEGIDKKVNISPLTLKIDNTNANGFVRITFSEPTLIEFDMAMDQLDASHYGSTASPSNNKFSPMSHANAEPKETLLPLDSLRNMNMRGHIKVGKLVLSKMTLNQLNLGLSARQGLLQLNPFQAQLYQGIISGKLLINTNTSEPQWNINAIFQHIDIQPLVQSLEKIFHLQLSGRGDLSANLITVGNRLPDIKSHLNGNATFMIKDGVLHGIDIPYYSDLADALANKSQPTLSNTQQTSFGKLTGTAQFSQGIVSNHDLLMEAPQMRVTGNGTANLVTEQLNYRLALQRLTSGSVVKLRGPAIPLLINGSFSAPKIRPDWQVLLVNEAKNQFKEQLRKKTQETFGENSQLSEQLQQGLSALLGG